MESLQATTKTLFSVKELRWLLTEIKDNGPAVRIKFRLAKEGWQDKFYALSHVTDTSVVLMDETNNQLKFISFNEITQFTLNKVFQRMAGHSHYDILLEA